MATKELVRSKPCDPTIRVIGSQVMVAKDAEMTTCSDKSNTSECSAVEQIMSINRKLVVQIETLRLKVDVDRRQHERQTSGLLNVTDRKVKLRDLEIANLRTELQKKEGTVQNLSTEFDRKESEVSTLQAHLDELREDIRESRVYVDEMQVQLEQLMNEKESLETGAAYRKKDEQITKLQKEVATLKTTMETMEKELILAKDKISQQGSKLRNVDVERTSMQVKFKEEMAKVSHNVRHEIEMTREVMLRQWKEIKELREQNKDMRSDIREIKELLTSELQPANVYGHSQTPYTVQSPTPSLPSISKQHRRSFMKKK